MGKLNDILTGHKVLEVKESQINGTLEVIKDLAWGTYIKGGGLTQSGGVAERVWRASLRKVARDKKQVANSLILGLGGGSIAKLIREYWGDEVEITGVDIDPVIVDLGKKHMRLSDYKVNIHIQDAAEFVKLTLKNNEKYDFICVDMYVKDDAPAQFAKKEFVMNLKKITETGGIIVFNRLYYGEKRELADTFYLMLKEIFSNVESVRPEANVMFICKN